MFKTSQKNFGDPLSRAAHEDVPIKKEVEVGSLFILWKEGNLSLCIYKQVFFFGTSNFFVTFMVFTLLIICNSKLTRTVLNRVLKVMAAFALVLLYCTL